MQKVCDLITPENSLFKAFQTANGALYMSLFDGTPAASLDMQLLVNCGERYAAPLLARYTMADVVNYIIMKYGDNWKKVRNAITADYDFLKPYHLTQTTIGEKTAINESTGESTNKTGIVGFDSTEPADSDVDTNSNTANTRQTDTDNTTVETTGTTGTTPISDLLASEIEARKVSFIQLVVNDIRSQITLDIY